MSDEPKLISALQCLATALQMFQDRMAIYGDWDDGCFYYNNHAANELQEPIRLSQAALKTAAPFLSPAIKSRKIF
jgi:hypothetical protein